MDKKSGVSENVIGTILGLVAVGGFFYWQATDTPEPRPFHRLDALAMCQQAIAGYAIDKDKAEVPPVGHIESGGEYIFSWGASTKHARMRNGLGIDAPVSASCAVNASTRAITALTIDGKTVI
jgi:hypothetical protein